MALPICLCPILVPLETRARVLLVCHWSELKTSTNTARLLKLALTNSELIDRGRKGKESDPSVSLDPAYQPILLFPTEDARELTPEALAEVCGSRPPLLIVPDGNWRQASKIPRREPAFASIPKFRLAEGPPSRFFLRREPNEKYVCTLEAVARALGVLEGESGPAVRAQLERLLDVMVSRVLWSHGKVESEEVIGGLPEGANAFRSLGGKVWKESNPKKTY